MPSNRRKLFTQGTMWGADDLIAPMKYNILNKSKSNNVFALDDELNYQKINKNNLDKKHTFLKIVNIGSHYVVHRFVLTKNNGKYEVETSKIDPFGGVRALNENENQDAIKKIKRQTGINNISINNQKRKEKFAGIQNDGYNCFFYSAYILEKLSEGETLSSIASSWEKDKKNQNIREYFYDKYPEMQKKFYEVCVPQETRIKIISDFAKKAAEIIGIDPITNNLESDFRFIRYNKVENYKRIEFPVLQIKNKKTKEFENVSEADLEKIVETFPNKKEEFEKLKPVEKSIFVEKTDVESPIKKRSSINGNKTYKEAEQQAIENSNRSYKTEQKVINEKQKAEVQKALVGENIETDEKWQKFVKEQEEAMKSFKKSTPKL